MRRFLIVGVILILSSGLLGAGARHKDRRPGTQKRREDRQREFLREHTDRSGRVRPDLWEQGIRHLRGMTITGGIAPSSATAAAEASILGLAGAQWAQIGPAPLRIDAGQEIYQGAGPDSGEVVDVAIAPTGSTDQVIYIATNDGGIWKSTDGGTTWKPKTDSMPSLSMGAIALDPVNPSIVYAGTGNLFDGGIVFTKGVGIYKSSDAGETWPSILNPGSIFTNKGVNRIV